MRGVYAAVDHRDSHALSGSNRMARRDTERDERGLLTKPFGCIPKKRALRSRAGITTLEVELGVLDFRINDKE